ncbi:hypothetical protein E3V08_06245 [Candidatus Atribacteria bacterium MT.SAG.1]|nr:hypothetical protein E3V08_06245 [Candidatus Atribacteria bacterium MT.SAG.1]
MEPHVGRIAFTLGIFVLILALIPLPFLRRDSAEFTVSLMAAVLSSVFLGFVVWSVRRQVHILRVKPDKKRQNKAQKRRGKQEQDSENVKVRE